MDAFSLKDKTILITGASSGIGRSCALECAKSGASVILLGRNLQRLQETFASLEGENHHYFLLDITNQDEIELFLKKISEEKLKISGLVHCAGEELTLPFKNTKKEHFLKIFDVNVFSGFELARRVSNIAFRDQTASYVFISSIKGVVGDFANVAYSATKGALISGVKSMALELAKQKIRANCVSPGFVKTPMTESFFENEEFLKKISENYPLGTGTVVDVANACVFLLSDASKWITGTNLVVDGGYTAK